MFSEGLLSGARCCGSEGAIQKKTILHRAIFVPEATRMFRTIAMPAPPCLQTENDRWPSESMPSYLFTIQPPGSDVKGGLAGSLAK
jgi:hypothetical protein